MSFRLQRQTKFVGLRLQRQAKFVEPLIACRRPTLLTTSGTSSINGNVCHCLLVGSSRQTSKPCTRQLRKRRLCSTHLSAQHGLETPTAGIIRKQAAIVFASWLRKPASQIAKLRRQHGVTGGLQALENAITGALDPTQCSAARRKKRLVSVKLEPEEPMSLEVMEGVHVVLPAVNLRISTVDFQSLLLWIALTISRDNLIIYATSVEPAWHHLNDQELWMWYSLSLTITYPKETHAYSPHAWRWFYFFGAHRRSRETPALFQDVIFPFALQVGAPPWFLWFASMMRRFFHSPISWSLFWPFLKSLYASGTYKPVRHHREGFMTAYVAATAAGASPTTWDAETHGLIDVDASKASAWGPGSRTLVFPGASSYVESAWLYAQEFESLSMTVWSLLSVHLANGVLAPADFPTRLSKLYRSSFAFGVAGYYLKHMHMDIAGAVDAMELHRGQGYDFHAYCKAALLLEVRASLEDDPPIGPGPVDWFKWRLQPLDVGQQCAFAQQDRGLPYWIGPATFHTGCEQVLKFLGPKHELNFFSAAEAILSFAYNRLDASSTTKRLQQLPGLDAYGYHVLRSWAVCVRFLRSECDTNLPVLRCLQEEYCCSHMSAHVEALYSIIGERGWPKINIW